MALSAELRVVLGQAVNATAIALTAALGKERVVAAKACHMQRQLLAPGCKSRSMQDRSGL